MNFASFAFLALFAIVITARLTIGRRKIEPMFVRLLLLSSLVFYAWHIPEYLLVLLASTVIDFVAARAIGRIDDEPRRTEATSSVTRRRRWLVLSLAANLGLLAWFKYAGFLGDNARALAELLGLGWTGGEWAFVLPMGISFYTFQSMSYTIDVYRGHIAPARRFGDFLLYVSFFPQLVAGPIVRASEFLPQMTRPRRLRWASATEGLSLIVSGYFLKVVCADNLAAFVDEAWPAAVQPGASSIQAAWTMVLFSGQIFADFAGYSNIARGLAYLLGYRLPLNFDLPYIATSFKDFWQRWHITLSSWLRDYLYLPLGGNRRGAARTYANLAAVMLLGGLWHGAAWTFVAWGAMHGAALAVERALGLHRSDVATRPTWVRFAWPVVVQVVVLISWVPFRSASLTDTWQLLTNVLRFDVKAPSPQMWAAAVFLYPLIAWHAWGWFEARQWTAPMTLRTRATVAAAMAVAVLMAYGQSGAFIYFQF